MADKIIELQFGVLGGGSIEGESGKKIANQITNIANHIKPKIRFQADTTKIKTELEKINKTVAASSTSGSGNNGVTAQTKSVSELKKEVNQLVSLWKNAHQATKENSAEVQAYQRQFDYLNQEYEKDKAAAIAAGSATQEEVTALEQKLLLTKQITEAKAGDYAQTKAEKEDKQVADLTQKYAELQKKLAGLVDRYKDLQSVSPTIRTLSEQANSLANIKWNKTQSLEEMQENVTGLKLKTAELEKQFSDASVETDTLGNKIKKAFGSSVVQLIAHTIQAVLVKYLKQVYTIVLDINSAMTQLQIVTKATSSEMESFATTITEAAKSIGSSVSDLVESTTTFTRLGFSLEDSTKYATLIAQYAKVADTTVEDATTNMTAAIKAFGISGDEFEKALDKLIKVGKIVAQLCSNVQKEDSYIG